MQITSNLQTTVAASETTLEKGLLQTQDALLQDSKNATIPLSQTSKLYLNLDMDLSEYIQPNLTQDSIDKDVTDSVMKYLEANSDTHYEHFAADRFASLYAGGNVDYNSFTSAKDTMQQMGINQLYLNILTQLKIYRPEIYEQYANDSILKSTFGLNTTPEESALFSYADFQTYSMEEQKEVSDRQLANKYRLRSDLTAESKTIFYDKYAETLEKTLKEAKNAGYSNIFDYLGIEDRDKVINVVTGRGFSKSKWIETLQGYQKSLQELAQKHYDGVPNDFIQKSMDLYASVEKTLKDKWGYGDFDVFS